MEQHTYPHGLIGNCGFLALINRDTNIDWMCWPRFDSPFVFGKLIAGDRGGRFSVEPVKPGFACNQEYRANTNILETTISTGEDAYRVTDFAPRFVQQGRYYRPLMLIRKVEPVRGLPRVKVCCDPVQGYEGKALQSERGSSHIRFHGLREPCRLSTNISLNYITDHSAFVLDRSYYLVFTYGVPLEGPIEKTVEDFLRETTQYWANWIKSTSIGKYFQKAVIRSSLTLKICQYEDTGAIIASPTTSLPEAPGHGRNWDYRFSWMRDTYYTLTAFNHIGHFEEMERYFNFLTNIPMQERQRIQPLYSITGEAQLTEKLLELPGYLGNQPVRIGNDAYSHVQNDVYGQILLAILPLYVDQRFQPGSSQVTDYLLRSILEKIEKTINEKDAGIWEFRGKALLHTYTSLFQWAGSAAAARVAEQLENPDLARMARALQKRAAANIEKAYQPELQAYSHAVDSPFLDASTLQLILMNYLPPHSKRAQSHLKALEKELKASKGLFYRYLHEDDFGKPANTFLVCGFWYAECLAAVGRVEEAGEALEELIQYGNHLGLFSEDIHAESGSQWGNFPQAYSHVGMVNAAYRINNKISEPSFL